MNLAVFQAGFTTLPRAPLAHPLLSLSLSLSLSHTHVALNLMTTKVPFVRLVGMIDQLNSQPASSQQLRKHTSLLSLSLSLFLPPPSPRMIMLKLCQSHEMFGHEGFLCK